MTFTEIGRGEQAMVGFLKIPGDHDVKFLKIPRDVSFTIFHEHAIGNRMNELEHVNNYFMGIKRLVPLFVADVMRLREETDISTEPFESCISRMALEMEYLRDAVSLTEYIDKNKRRIKEKIFPILRLCLAAVRIAHEASGFTHYDLHTDNVMVRPGGKKDWLHVFIFADGTQEVILGTDVEPVVIDFGRSYCDALDGSQLNIELYHTHSAIFSTCSHHIIDTLFLINSCAVYLKETANSDLLLNKVNKCQTFLDEYGWWKNEYISAMETVTNIAREVSGESLFFSDYLEHGIIIFGHLSTIPLEHNSDWESRPLLAKYFGKFVHEWVRFEKWFSSAPHMAHFLAYFVQVLCIHRDEYSNPATKSQAEQKIMSTSSEYLDIAFTNTWYSGDINWPEFIRTGYLTGCMIENLIAEVMNTQTAEFKEITKGFTFKSLFQMVPIEKYDPAKIRGGIVINSIQRTKKIYNDPKELFKLLRRPEAAPPPPSTPLQVSTSRASPSSALRGPPVPPSSALRGPPAPPSSALRGPLAPSGSARRGSPAPNSTRRDSLSR